MMHDAERFESGGPTEAGLTAATILTAIGTPIAIVVAALSKNGDAWPIPLLIGTSGVFCFACLRFTARELIIRDDSVIFRRVGGRPLTVPKSDVHVVRGFSNFGSDAVFHIDGFAATFRFPLDYTSSPESGVPLTLDHLKELGIEVR